MMRTSLAIASLLIAFSGPEQKTGKTEKPPTVTALQGGKLCKFSAGGMTSMEGLVLAILGTCEVDAQGEHKDLWTRTLAEENVHIVYGRRRLIGVTPSAGDDVLEVSEILIPLSAEQRPDTILVREGERYRVFTNFQSNRATPEKLRLQEYLPRSK